MDSTASSDVPAKRQRTDDTGPIPQQGKFWLDDGNVILQTQTESIQFRVHRSVLARHSPFFRDMFALPQPSACQSDTPVVPVIYVDDSPQDLEIFFEQLYGDTMCSRMKDILDMDYIAALLRLGTKYQVHVMRSAMLDHLSKDLTANIDSFPSITHITSYRGVEFDLLNLLTSTGCSRFLPAAFLLAAHHSVIHIMDGISTIEDGRQKHTALTPENIRSVLVGREACLHAQYNLSTGWRPTDSLLCPQCPSRPGTRLVHSTTLTFTDLFTVHAFPTWSRVEWERTYCSACLAKSGSNFQASRQQFWHRLPSLFGLPEWDVLLKPDECS